MAVGQGALQLRDLHEDTTGPSQGREGGENVLKLNVNSTGKQYLSHEPQLTSWSCHVTVSPSDSSDDTLFKVYKFDQLSNNWQLVWTSLSGNRVYK